LGLVFLGIPKWMELPLRTSQFKLMHSIQLKDLPLWQAYTNIFRLIFHLIYWLFLLIFIL
jgi:hypothetical protein